MTGKESGNTSGLHTVQRCSCIQRIPTFLIKGSFFWMSGSPLLHQTKEYCSGLQTRFTTYGCWMKKGCDLQTPEGSKNEMGVRHTYHVKLYPSINFSWKECSSFYCNIWKMDSKGQKSRSYCILKSLTTIGTNILSGSFKNW